jgi:hypothetical protein
VEMRVDDAHARPPYDDRSGQKVVGNHLPHAALINLIYYW